MIPSSLPLAIIPNLISPWTENGVELCSIEEDNKQLNRFLRSNRVVEEGVEIGREIDFLSSLHPSRLSTHCHQCYTPFNTTKKLCTACRSVRYCSLECQRLHWLSHKLECSLLSHYQQKSNSPIQTPTLMTVLRLILRRERTMKVQRNEILGMSTAEIQTSKEYMNSLEQLKLLKSHLDKASEKRKTEYYQMSVGLRQMIRDSRSSHLTGTSNYVMEEEQKEEKEEKKIEIEKESSGSDLILSVAEMSEWFARLSVNGLTSCDEEMIPIALSLYPTISYINHSCEPNCAISFQKNIAIIRTIRKITEGEMITISYIDTAATTAQRQIQLQQSYHFTCKCELCISEAVGERDCYLTAFKCSNKLISLTKCDGVLKESQQELICIKCNRIVSSQIAQELKYELEKIEETVREAESATPSIAITLLTASITNLNSLVSPYHLLLYSVYNQLYSHTLSLKLYPQTTNTLLSLLPFYSYYYGNIHPLTAMQMIMLVKSLVYEERWEECHNLQRKEKLVEKVRLSLGEESELYLKIQKWMSEAWEELQRSQSKIQ